MATITAWVVTRRAELDMGDDANETACAVHAIAETYRSTTAMRYPSWSLTGDRTSVDISEALRDHDRDATIKQVPPTLCGDVAFAALDAHRDQLLRRFVGPRDDTGVEA